MRIPMLAAAVLVALMPLSAMAADDFESRLKLLETNLGRQSETIRQQQTVIEELKQQAAKQADDPASNLTGLFGGSLMTNPYISLVLDTKGYVSNLKNGELNARGIPGYTAEGRGMRNGFNVDAAELLIFAPVDPYFNLYTNIPINGDGAVLEEAYFVTTDLPAGFQVKGGRFKSNASRLNSQHPHAWDFADLPLPYKSFLGPEALGGENGVQLTWLPSLPIYTLLGFEALQGDNPLLFGNDDNWGPHAFTAFAKFSVDTSDNSSLYFGPWAMFGSTRTSSILPTDATTGNSFDLRGNSALYGMEALWKWKSGHQKLTLQSEYLYLVQNGTLSENDPSGAVVASDHLKRHQDGAYLQALYGIDRWGFGARYDRMEIFSDTFERGGVQQTYNSKPWRLTGSLEFKPTEFTQIRAQYSHDRSARDGRVNNESILQFIFTIGAHGAHAF